MFPDRTPGSPGNSPPYTAGMTGRPLQIKFVASAKHTGQLPETDAEVAFVGRSNVGKSSLINALANQKQLARVSNTPGRTQLINIFEHRDGGTVVDLPGYGYAKVPGHVRREWPEMIEGYLLERDGLEMVFVLVDGAIGPTPLDQQMLGVAAGERGPAHGRRHEDGQGEVVQAPDAQGGTRRRAACSRPATSSG